MGHITETFDTDRRLLVKTLDFEGYWKSYYCKTISPDFTSQDIQRMCHDYLKSFIWILEYYVHGLASWSWAYKWHYAPLMKDFSAYIQGLSIEEFKKISEFEMNEPSVPFAQLLSVLPPPSAPLLPKPYRKLMSTKGKLFKLGYYPSKFPIDYEGKIKEYQGIAILPFVDYNHIRSAYAKVKTKSHTRNNLGNISLFVYDSSYTSTFSSDMGNIDQLHVKKTVLPPHRL